MDLNIKTLCLVNGVTLLPLGLFRFVYLRQFVPKFWLSIVISLRRFF